MGKNNTEQNKQLRLQKLKQRYQEDIKFREKVKEIYREKYRTDPEYRAITLQRSKERYHTDENYRKATIERSKIRGKKLKEDKEKKITK